MKEQEKCRNKKYLDRLPGLLRRFGLRFDSC